MNEDASHTAQPIRAALQAARQIAEISQDSAMLALLDAADKAETERANFIAYRRESHLGPRAFVEKEPDPCSCRFHYPSGDGCRFVATAPGKETPLEKAEAHGRLLDRLLQMQFGQIRQLHEDLAMMAWGTGLTSKLTHEFFAWDRHRLEMLESLRTLGDAHSNCVTHLENAKALADNWRIVAKTFMAAHGAVCILVHGEERVGFQLPNGVRFYDGLFWRATPTLPIIGPVAADDPRLAAAVAALELVEWDM